MEIEGGEQILQDKTVVGPHHLEAWPIYLVYPNVVLLYSSGPLQKKYKYIPSLPTPATSAGLF